MNDFEEHIIYEDKQFMVCYKPPGVPVQSAGVGVMDLECACLNYLHEKSRSAKKMPYVGIVQRLDQPVEGLLVLAKDRKAAGELGMQVQDGRMKKTYLAVVDGMVELSEGVLQNWLVKDSRTRMAKVVSERTQGAREAKLSFRVLKRREERTLLEVHLFTGRYHQIRIQLSHWGVPLVGDSKYNPRGGSQPGGIGLCAYRLRLVHPVSGKMMEWEIWPKGKAFQGWDV